MAFKGQKWYIAKPTFDASSLTTHRIYIIYIYKKKEKIYIIYMLLCILYCIQYIVFSLQRLPFPVSTCQKHSACSTKGGGGKLFAAIYCKTRGSRIRVGKYYTS